MKKGKFWIYLKSVILFFLFFWEIVSLSPLLFSSDLPERYRKWLEEEVVYLITPKEKEVFLKLQSDRERDIFIEAFWKQRDPTPGTPRNEFREEHYRRLNYANQFLGRGTGKPGWKTDQGRIYIILGPPNNIEKYEDLNGVYPTQVWFYYGDTRYGLPAAFNIIFYKKGGGGEYVLYSPSDDGPQALVADYMYNAKDARDAYQMLYQLSPNLAEQSLSLIPSERMEPGVINLASNRLLATIFSLPQRQVEDNYAEAWFKYKDLIEVDYSTNYINADYEIWTVRDKQGNYLLNYSVEPGKVSAEEEAQGYTVRFDLNGRLSDERGRTIYQFEKSLPLTLTRSQLEEIGKRAVTFQDVFPVIPGTYTFDLLVKNPLSKEFSGYSQKIQLPAEISSPTLGPILLAYASQNLAEESTLVPYQINKIQLLSRVRKTFTPSDSLVVCLQVLGVKGTAQSKAQLKLILIKENQPVWTKDINLNQFQSEPLIMEKISLSPFVPGYYTVEAEILIEGQVRNSRRAELEISSLPALATPIVVSRGSLSESEELFVTGIQLLNQGENAEAILRLGAAFSQSPGIKQALAYGEALFRSGEYRKVTELLKPYDQPEAPAELLSLLGRSYHSLNQLAAASIYYEQYLKQFGTNVEILNYLGSCYYQLGNKEKALSVWEKSLSLNPDQEKLKELVNSLKKNN
ncbi:MAG: GWxTD domain-containing protein [Candidatus Aminicenantes bacterium]|jgi:GWxTD domain-containing protein|nr:GWxTD domain-containing protein [Candidatus Aminicenantes bacterium]